MNILLKNKDEIIKKFRKFSRIDRERNRIENYKDQKRS